MYVYVYLSGHDDRTERITGRIHAFTIWRLFRLQGHKNSAPNHKRSEAISINSLRSIIELISHNDCENKARATLETCSPFASPTPLSEACGDGRWYLPPTSTLPPAAAAARDTTDSNAYRCRRVDSPVAASVAVLYHIPPTQNSIYMLHWLCA